MAAMAGDSPLDAMRSARVLACDVFPPMAALANRLVSASPYADSIRVVNLRSDELTVAEPGAPQACSASRPVALA